jgi:hypothetical protein
MTIISWVWLAPFANHLSSVLLHRPRACITSSNYINPVIKITENIAALLVTKFCRSKMLCTEEWQSLLCVAKKNPLAWTMTPEMKMLYTGMQDGMR